MGFLLSSTFVPKGLSAPAFGLYACIKALKYIPGPGVRRAFTGPLVLWFMLLVCYLIIIFSLNMLKVSSHDWLEEFWIFDRYVALTVTVSDKYQNKEKQQKCQRRLGLVKRLIN